MLSLKKTGSTWNGWYYLPTTEIKNYNVTSNEQNLFDQSVKNDVRICDNIWNPNYRISDECSISSFFDYTYFKKNYKLIAIDLSKQLALKINLKAMQQINVEGNLERAGNKTMFLIIQVVNEIILDFRKLSIRKCHSKHL